MYVFIYTDQIASVLKYHVIPGDRSIPRGFKSGEAIKTLEGQAVKVEYKRYVVTIMLQC